MHAAALLTVSSSLRHLPHVLQACGSSLVQYTSMLPLINTLFTTLHYVVLVLPLEQLYFRALWTNRALPDICAALTNHDASFWTDHSADCMLIIDRNFDGLLAMVQCALYVAVWLVGFWWCCCRRQNAATTPPDHQRIFTLISSSPPPHSSYHVGTTPCAPTPRHDEEAFRR